MAKHVWRDVVGHEDRPYDRDSSGNVLTIRMLALSCGHKVVAEKRQTIGLDATTRPAAKRKRCPKCEKGSM